MALNYARVITDDEMDALENDLLDVEDWINRAIEGKINNCKKRLAIARRQELIAGGATTVPATDDALVADAVSDPKYKKRKDREKDND